MAEFTTPSGLYIQTVLLVYEGAFLNRSPAQQQLIFEVMSLLRLQILHELQ